MKDAAEVAEQTPPAKPPEVATAASTANGQHRCPVSGEMCVRQCVPTSGGRTYCWTWVDQQREAGRRGTP